MKIGIYAKVIANKTQFLLAKSIIDFLQSENIDIYLHQNLFQQFKNFEFAPIADNKCFSHLSITNKSIDYLVTIGGDGTILDAIEIIGSSGIPLIGINTGRLGFLASVSSESLISTFNELKRGSYQLDKRSLLQLESNLPLFDFNYAMNDFVLHKKETSSMITVHAFLNGEPLNSYWADGLIVATPTGSTGYSLSCGGPILFPKSASLVVTPIAPHNLNVRPVIIPDDQVLSFEIEGRSNFHLASLDSRSVTIDSNVQIAIRKANFEINLVRFEGDTYLKNLRNKMLWGLDQRN